MEKDDVMNLRKIAAALIFTIVFVFVSCGLVPSDENTYFEIRYDLGADSISPGKNSFCYEDLPLFLWDVDLDVLSYQFQLSESPLFNGPFLVDNMELSASQFQLAEPLSINKAYYWRFRMLDSENVFSSWYSTRFFRMEENVFDNFEVNDGTFSILHDWELKGDIKPVVQSSVNYEGSYAVKLGSYDAGYDTDSILSLDVEFSNQVLVSFSTKNSTGYLSFGNDVYLTSIYSENYDDWNSSVYIMDPSSRELYWKINGGEVYIDNIKISELISLSSESFNVKKDSNPLPVSWHFDGEIIPRVQNIITNSGGKAIQFGKQELDSGFGYNSSSFETTVSLSSPAVLSFYMKTNYRSGYTRFYINSTSKISQYSDSDWIKYSYALGTGAYDLKWLMDQYDQKYVWIEDIQINTIIPFADDNFETYDSSFSTQNNWQLYGDTVPFIQSAEFNDGTSSVQFGNIDNYDESVFEVAVNVAQTSTVSFFYKVESRSGDYFSFYIDGGSARVSRSGTYNWTQFQYTLTPGLHILKWRYNKDYGNISGRDTAWVDSITITTP